jgi:hypothetical protein
LSHPFWRTVSLCPIPGSRKGFVENAEDFYQITVYAVWKEVGKLADLKLVHPIRSLGRVAKKGVVEQMLRPCTIFCARRSATALLATAV